MILGNYCIPDNTPLKLRGAKSIGGETHLLIMAVGLDITEYIPSPLMRDEETPVKELWRVWSERNPNVYSSNDTEAIEITVDIGRYVQRLPKGTLVGMLLKEGILYPMHRFK